MKKPRFGVLADLAGRREDEARKRVGACERAIAEQQDAIAALERERAQASAGGLALRDVWAAWWRRQDGLIANARGELARREQALAAAREELIAAHREAATWDKLRERDRLAIAADAERRAAKELDDFGARRREGG